MSSQQYFDRLVTKGDLYAFAYHLMRLMRANQPIPKSMEPLGRVLRDTLICYKVSVHNPWYQLLEDINGHCSSFPVIERLDSEAKVTEFKSECNGDTEFTEDFLEDFPCVSELQWQFGELDFSVPELVDRIRVIKETFGAIPLPDPIQWVVPPSECGFANPFLFFGIAPTPDAIVLEDEREFYGQVQIAVYNQEDLFCFINSGGDLGNGLRWSTPFVFDADIDQLSDYAEEIGGWRHISDDSPSDDLTDMTFDADSLAIPMSLLDWFKNASILMIDEHRPGMDITKLVERDSFEGMFSVELMDKLYLAFSPRNSKQFDDFVSTYEFMYY